MNLPHQGHRIVWLVRLLTIIGLLTVISTIGLVGWTLAHVRTERALAIAERDPLNRVSDELRQRAAESRVELQTVLDETLSLTNGSGGVPGLIQVIAGLSAAQTRAEGRAASTQFAPLMERLTEVSRRGREWRASYDIVWQDVRQQRTLGLVRALITQLGNDVDTFEGRHRLDEAIQYRRWRTAADEASHQLARTILEEQGRERSQGLNDLKSELAECARLVEVLGGEEQIDSLADLKDNKLKPVLDRLSRATAALSHPNQSSKSRLRCSARGLGVAACLPSAPTRCACAASGRESSWNWPRCSTTWRRPTPASRSPRRRAPPR